MTRAAHVTHGNTAARLEKIRKLVTALQAGEMMREDIASLLKVGPSGVRGYINDLRGAGVMGIARYVDGTAYALGRAVYCILMDAEQAAAYLAGLAALPVARAGGGRSGLEVAARDPSRHFHILRDDEPYSVRVSRKPTARDPLVAALFGAGPAAMGARA
ncbi:ArsR family transcriptional regulator [Massilia forsythiae]|uniref:ArsR family transcriptional regulator n=1 Tax=Massilia forsythiae TaxID=2728020 RepID=A0A7Z2VT11_9BURK|nr:ArsR family transcriptional regulator [Massilia forsythiae]QJD98623.1 ArsR family transcriptional regulator [Massilia forsythiae]